RGRTRPSPGSPGLRRARRNRMLVVVDAAPSQLAVLAEVGESLDRAGFEYWLFGGWAVDFYLGAITREHGDIDLAVWADDAEAIGALLRSSGWRHRPKPDEDGGTGYELGAIRIEPTFLARDQSKRVFIAFRDQNALWWEQPL